MHCGPAWVQKYVLYFTLSPSDQTSTSNMKIDTLNFLTVLLTQHSPAVLHPHIGVIIPAVVTAVDDNFYKITSEALLVLNLVVKTIRPLSECEGVCLGKSVWVGGKSVL